jgi:hypothetical protein
MAGGGRWLALFAAGRTRPAAWSALLRQRARAHSLPRGDPYHAPSGPSAGRSGFFPALAFLFVSAAPKTGSQFRAETRGQRSSRTKKPFLRRPALR